MAEKPAFFYITQCSSKNQTIHDEQNYLILFLLVIITTFYLVFTFYNDYTDVGELNLKASKETIIQKTQRILSGCDIPVSSDYVSVRLFYDDVMADRLSEAADYQNLKKDAPFYYWHITASNSPQESQQTIRGSVKKTNIKTNPSIELKMDNQLNLKQLFIPDRYFRDLRQNK